MLCLPRRAYAVTTFLAVLEAMKDAESVLEEDLAAAFHAGFSARAGTIVDLTEGVWSCKDHAQQHNSYLRGRDCFAVGKPSIFTSVLSRSSFP